MAQKRTKQPRETAAGPPSSQGEGGRDTVLPPPPTSGRRKGPVEPRVQNAGPDQTRPATCEPSRVSNVQETDELDRMLERSLRLVDPSESPSSRESVLEGRIQDISLPNLLQTFASANQSGTLEIIVESRVGSVLIHKGVVIACKIDQIGGAAAFYRMLRFRVGRFAFYPNLDHSVSVPEQVGLGVSTHTLLLESLPRIEEIERLETLIPGPHVSMTLSECCRGEDIFSLGEAALMLFLTIQGSVTVEGLRMNTELSDLELAQSVVDLMRAGLLAVDDITAAASGA